MKEGSTGGNTLVAYIRGLGQANYSLAFQPGVPIYVDDIYQPTAFGSMLTLGDIERVDVLRGPQGTLFGKNSEGGAVSIRQVDPKGDKSGYAEAGVGSYNDPPRPCCVRYVPHRRYIVYARCRRQREQRRLCRHVRLRLRESEQPRNAEVDRRRELQDRYRGRP